MKKNNFESQRKSDTTPVGDAIKALLKHYRLQNKFDETKLIASWERIMGKTIAQRTSKLYIKDKKLFVGVNSAPLKNQLLLSKEKIILIFDNEIGEGIITDVILI